MKSMKYLISIIVVLLLIAPCWGLFSWKSSASSEANETIANRTVSTKATMEPREETAALEQRLADVL